MERVFAIEKMVVIGGSAGSMQPLLALLGALPLHFSAAVVLVLHRQRNVQSRLDILLSHQSKAPITEPEDKELLQSGHIYLAPQNYHLLLEREGTFALEYSEPVCFSRPSIDVTLQSAAFSGVKNLLAVILSGANHDGAAGVSAVLKAGGDALIQAPETAEFPVMPEASRLQNPGGEVLSLVQMAGKLAQFVS